MDAKELHEPWLVAAWPGMGAVGLLAASTLAKLLGAEGLGELDTTRYFDVRQLEVENGLFQPATHPRTLLFAWKAPPGGRDLLVLLGEAQPGAEAWSYARAVVGVARDLGVQRVVTFAAMGAPIDPRAEHRVFAAASDAALLEEARRSGLPTLQEGEVSGLNGVLIGAAAESGIAGLCLLGEFPYFASAVPNPRASAAVLKAFGELAGVAVDAAELETQAAEIEDELVTLGEELEAAAKRRHIPGFPLEADDEPEPEEVAELDVDHATRVRLEAMFDQARADRDKALELKAELDRLGLFREYEDRFLDLFRKAG